MSCLQGHGRHGGLKSKTVLERIFVLQRGVADCLNFLITSLSTVLEGGEHTERLMRGLAPHLCCTKFDNMFLMLVLALLFPVFKPQQRFHTRDVDILVPIPHLLSSSSLSCLCATVYWECASVFILQAVFLLSDTRGHKINVKNIYRRRLDTQITGASRSKEVGTVVGNLDKYPCWSLVQIN